MILYLTATTQTPDILIDYIELELANEAVVSLTWDESGINRSEEGFDARYKGVQFDEEYANGCLAELKDFKIVGMSLYSPTEMPCDLKITQMIFEDGGEEYVVDNPRYISDEEA